jgi:hypothetical protein
MSPVNVSEGLIVNVEDRKYLFNDDEQRADVIIENGKVIKNRFGRIDADEQAVEELARILYPAYNALSSSTKLNQRRIAKRAIDAGYKLDTERS